ncbi:MAG: hypothetical protein QW279_08330 [Candidatus Jordarchaeaceae archaeon]
MLSKESLKELREILREDFKINLNHKDLFEFGNNLLAYFELLAKIYFENQFEDENRIKFDSLKKEF